MAKYSESRTTVVTGKFKDLTPQEPAGRGLADAITVLWGAGGTTSDGAHTIQPDGSIIVVKNDKEYVMYGEIRIGRETGAGTAELIVWTETSMDGNTWSVRPDGNPTVIHLSGADQSGVATGKVGIDRGVPIGLHFRLRLARGDAANDSGGLIPWIASGTFAGLPSTGSALLTIEKIEAQ